METNNTRKRQVSYICERVLRWLEYGDTPADRVDNAISYLRYLNLSDEELLGLKQIGVGSYISLGVKNNNIWIKDSIPLFVHALRKEPRGVLYKENQETSKEMFWDYVKAYASALNECVNIYTNRNTFAVKGDLSELILWKLSVLNKSYDNFVVALYDEMEGIDSSDQHVLYGKISAYLSDAIFDQNYSIYNYNSRDSITGDQKRELISLIERLKYCTNWIGTHHLGGPLYNFRKDYEQYVNSVKKSREIANESQDDKLNCSNSLTNDTKLALTRDEICLLFKSLKDANCILNKDFKDIATDVSNLTGFSKEKIRQKLGTDKVNYESRVPLRLAEVLRQIANDLDPQQ